MCKIKKENFWNSISLPTYCRCFQREKSIPWHLSQYSNVYMLHVVELSFINAVMSTIYFSNAKYDFLLHANVKNQWEIREKHKNFYLFKHIVYTIYIIHTKTYMHSSEISFHIFFLLLTKCNFTEFFLFKFIFSSIQTPIFKCIRFKLIRNVLRTLTNLLIISLFEKEMCIALCWKNKKKNVHNVCFFFFTLFWYLSHIQTFANSQICFAPIEFVYFSHPSWKFCSSKKWTVLRKTAFCFYVWERDLERVIFFPQTW